MKTIEDLRALYQTIINDLETMEIEVGDGFSERNGYGYYEDGWEIEFSFNVKGEFSYTLEEFVNVEVTSLELDLAVHVSAVPYEETEFEGDDLEELRQIVKETISDRYVQTRRV